MTIEWKFPHNGFGQVRGVSDAGIETFTGTEIQSLAREICQNSLDAAVEGSNATIKVDFEQYRIPSSDIPGYEQYASKIQKAYDYWSKKNSEKTIKVLTKALNAIKKPTTVVLRISDFNTTGLSHPYEDSDEGWNALTKLDGGATKTGDKAGAFGIGKNAPFTNSDYRLVFYRTLNEDQETAAQGMSRFISFPEDLSNSMNTMTTGIGYYGNPEGNLPVDSISELEKLYQRSEIGTDVFVYGFNAGYEWNSDVINEVLENFLMSIHKNLLSVTVDNKNIDNSTLASYLSTYNSSSIFKVYKRLTTEPKPMEVELSTAQIGIGLGLEEYEIYSRFCDKEKFQPILNSMMVFPALVYVFEELKQENGIENYAGTNWYISLSKAYEKRGVDLENELLYSDKTSVQLAQEAMELPLNAALRKFADLFESGEEEEDV